MHTKTLRKVDGSVMLPVPPAILEALHLCVGAKVVLAVDNGRLVVSPQPQPRPHYTLAALLEASDYSGPQPPEEREWIDAPPAGREPL